MVGSFQLWRPCPGAVRSISSVRSMLILFLLSAFSTEAKQEDSFIPPRATVILMSSLAGDVESENAYRGQLQTWLDVVATSNARRTIVLCDAPESVSLPTNAENKVFKAGRTNFLGLAATLAGETNPLVVIAWGHGGRQGSTAVFHVRGPRLAPADFQSLAGKLPAAQSGWILLFRGSGAFASQLAGPSREVISSESETM